ncbi:hypothetical protein H6A61_00625 [Bacteroides caecigallinarum]|uniref:PL29 family lyase N-terminal domain-containing protein n=1 Tax=Bacteroides caecigallinarum TaxID=1411144 RepID=UPI00195B8542|nr:PL29 family lyase N-terminal domain-containing protein [Bacteroides caecigallinarum]MBM6959375.1 hypothetical protein [Bacteroides caecigallinarum]
MKTFKFLMPFMLAVLVFAGCDTDDLRNDIDELKNRVESLEAQVASINENMNALRVLIDGNKTISSYTYDETTGAYTLTLSDGSVITLTQGVTGTVNYPTIGIDENGNWTVNGESLGQQAVGQNGDTPEFRIEESTNYWQVKFGAGEWQYVLSNGEKVQATTETINNEDKFFQSVEVKGGYLEVVMKDGQTLTMPIVDGLTCEIITEGVAGFSGNVLSVAAGATVKLNVNLSGDNFIVTAPYGWIATLGEPADGKAELSLTAPASASTFTRATADNTKDVVVQANKGINWAVDKIQVQIGENEGGGDDGEAVNYLEKYNSGETITIAGVEINKEKFGEAQHVTDANFAFTADHVVYFIDPSVEVNYSSTVNSPNLILIGTNSSQKSKITPTRQMKLSNSEANGLFLAYNLVINTENVMKDDGSENTYLLAQNGNNSFGKVMFDNVKLICLAGQSLTYISPNNRSISDFTIQNSLLEFTSGSHNQFLIGLAKETTATYPSINLVNNVFYSKDSKALLTKFKLFNGQKATIGNLKMHNNTFVNLATETTFYVYAGTVKTIDVTKNLYYTDVALSNNCGLIRATTFPTGTFCDDNIVYKVSSDFNWQVLFGGMNKNGFDGAKENTIIDVNPFDGGQFDLATGTFVPNPTYSGYGATIK